MIKAFTVYTTKIAFDENNPVEREIAELAKYTLESINHRLKYNALQFNQKDYIYFVPLGNQSKNAMIIIGKYIDSKQMYYTKIQAFSRENKGPVAYTNAKDVESLADTRRSKWLSSIAVDESNHMDNDILAEKSREAIQKDIENMKDKDLPAQILKENNTLRLYSNMGFIAGDIISIIRPDVKYDKNIYNNMFHCHRASYKTKNYIFVTFNEDYGIAPAEIIEPDAIKYPEFVNAILIQKTEVTVSKENGIPMINGMPAENYKGMEAQEYDTIENILIAQELKDVRRNNTVKNININNIAHNYTDNNSFESYTDYS